MQIPVQVAPPPILQTPQRGSLDFPNGNPASKRTNDLLDSITPSRQPKTESGTAGPLDFLDGPDEIPTIGPLPSMQASCAEQESHRHPAKWLMLIATIAWPILGVACGMAMYSSEVREFQPTGNGWYLNRHTLDVYDWDHVRSLAVASAVGGFIVVTVLWGLVMAFLFAIWFATSERD
jgi:hypothetical protein